MPRKRCSPRPDNGRNMNPPDEIPAGTPETRTTRTVYLAGELFSAKHLAGNAALSDHIFRDSGERFRCVLPQNMPQAVSPRAIRDQDLRALLACDAAVFHYDGLELDSGTVVEYLFAKFADMPAVLVRTDFRHAGDQKGGGSMEPDEQFLPAHIDVWLNSMDTLSGGPGRGTRSGGGCRWRDPTRGPAYL